MNTALRQAMSNEQLQQMVMRVTRRCGELYTGLQGSAYWRNRERFELRAKGDYAARQSDSEDPREWSIFDQRNASLRPVATVNGFLEARMCRDMFGTSPWFAVKPQGRLDGALAKQIQPHAGSKLKQAKFSARSKDAIRTTLDLGDCPVKVTWEVSTDESEEFQVVLVDKKTGAPVLDGDGLMITPERPDYEEEVPVEPEDALAGMEMDTTGALLKTRNARMFEGGVEFVPELHEFREVRVPKVTRLYSGLRIDPVEWRGFLFPIDAPSIEEADTIAVRSKMRLSKLRAMVQGRKRKPGELLPAGELPWSEEVETALEALKTTGQNAATPDYEHQRPELSEATAVSPEADPWVDVTEAYGEDDALEDGVMRRYCMILVEARHLCLWVDYRTSISPWAKKPVAMMAIHRPRNRMYGVGHYELFEMLEDLTDEQLNVILRTNEWNAMPPKVVNRKKLMANQQGSDFEITPGCELNPADGTTNARDIIEVVPWPDKSATAWQLMQLPMQIIQAWAGVTNAAQAAVSNLPGNDLATGINALAEVASVLHVHLLEQIREGEEDILSLALETLYLRQDRDETYEFLEGDAQGVMLLANAEILRKLPLNVELTLTRAKRQEDKEMALAGIPLAIQYGSLVPTEQARLKPMFEQALSGIGYSHPDQFLRTQEEILQGVMQELAAAGWQMLPPGADVGSPAAAVVPSSEPLPAEL